MTSNDLSDILNEKRVQNSMVSMLKINENVYYTCWKFMLESDDRAA